MIDMTHEEYFKLHNQHRYLIDTRQGTDQFWDDLSESGELSEYIAREEVTLTNRGAFRRGSEAH